jgi:mRNA interferase HigB
MRIIAQARLADFGAKHADARGALASWFDVSLKAEWRSLDDVRRTYSTADGVKVGSGRDATVFNIRGNRYRLITAIHYNAGLIYVGA